MTLTVAEIRETLERMVQAIAAPESVAIAIIDGELDDLLSRLPADGVIVAIAAAIREQQGVSHA